MEAPTRVTASICKASSNPRSHFTRPHAPAGTAAPLAERPNPGRSTATQRNPGPSRSITGSHTAAVLRKPCRKTMGAPSPRTRAKYDAPFTSTKLVPSTAGPVGVGESGGRSQRQPASAAAAAANAVARSTRRMASPWASSLGHASTSALGLRRVMPGSAYTCAARFGRARRERTAPRVMLDTAPGRGNGRYA